MASPIAGALVDGTGRVSREGKWTPRHTSSVLVHVSGLSLTAQCSSSQRAALLDGSEC